MLVRLQVHQPPWTAMASHSSIDVCVRAEKKRFINTQVAFLQYQYGLYGLEALCQAKGICV